MDKELHSSSTFIAFVLVAALVITVCALVVNPPTGLQNGMVIGKRHTEPQRIYNPVIFISQGKTRIRPATYDYGLEKWEVQVQNGIQVDWWTVNQEFYKNVNIGDEITK